MKHHASSTSKMDAPDRHNGQTQTNKQSCLFVGLRLRWSLTL